MSAAVRADLLCIYVHTVSTYAYLRSEVVVASLLFRSALHYSR